MYQKIQSQFSTVSFLSYRYLQDADENELIAIAGDEHHVYYVENFEDIATLAEPMTHDTNNMRRKPKK